MSDGVLVSSAQERFALGACRSLSRAGYRVGAVADQTPAATHWSRHCAARYVLPDARADADAFVEGLAGIARTTPYDVMLPAHDGALLAVSSRRERLEPALRLGLPPHAVVQAATDKIALDDFARSAGLGAPDTVVCQTREEGLAAARRLGLPVVVKPRRSAYEQDGAVLRRPSLLVGDQATLERAVGEFGTPFLLQGVIRGEVYSAAGVLSPGDGLLSFSLARYVRTWPPQAGNVAFAVTEPEPDGLRDGIARMLGALGWFGVFELEMIRGTDGRFSAIDLNPRLYGSLAHASRAGAPHAVVFCDWLLGRPQRPVTARPGVYYRWEDADLRNAIAALRERGPAAALDVLRPRRDVAHAFFAAGDPAPIAARALLLVKSRLEG
jgi:predicted ATP-grasp superfamily ATP-dependent carboligase